MQVKTSIKTLLGDHLPFRAMTYKTIKAIQDIKLNNPIKILAGYSIGYMDIELNATMPNQRIKQPKPSAPKKDNPNEIADVTRRQLLSTVFENTKQNTDEIIKVIAIRIKALGIPLNDNINIDTVGTSAPPIMPMDASLPKMQ